MTNLLHETMQAIRQGDSAQWGRIARELDDAITQRPAVRVEEQAREAVELEVLRAIAQRMAGFKTADIPVILARGNGAAIVEWLAKREEHGGLRVAYAAMQREFRMKKANLSMQLGHLEDNDIVRRTKEGRSTWVALSPSARKYAIAQEWMTEKKVDVGERLYDRSNVREPLKNPGALL